MKFTPFYLTTLLVGLACVVGLAHVGCTNPDPAYNDAVRLSALYVVPTQDLGAILKGTPNTSDYSASSAADPFQDSSYLLTDATNFSLTVYNSATTESRLEIQGDNSAIAGHINDIAKVEVVVETPDPSQIWFVAVNGKTINVQDFVTGAPLLVDNAAFESGPRLPGNYAVIETSALKAGDSLTLDVTVMANPGAKLHFDAYGSVWGARVLTTAAGTTLTMSPAPKPVLYPLAITRSGSGFGQVTSAPDGIACGATCSADFESGTIVVLSATPDTKSTFAGWSGACTGTDPCSVTLSAAKNVTATFQQKEDTVYPLQISTTGAGGGSVSSTPNGIDCGANCSANFVENTVVTLTATADATSIFSGWSGACTGTGTCSVSMTGTQSVTANFSKVSFQVQVTLAGSGTGLVSSDQTGINCGTTCAAGFVSGSTVKLTASPAAKSIFVGWSGACSGTGVCTISVSAEASVTATFQKLPDPTFAINVSYNGSGGGLITSAPSGINCGAVCSANFVLNTPVTLTATPDAGSSFAGWTGACSGTGPCQITVTQATTVTAKFDHIPVNYALNVVVTGHMAGTVTSSPAGITACSGNCSANFVEGTSVTLTMNDPVDADGVFLGWSGACTGSGKTCTIIVNGAKTATATFDCIGGFDLTATKSYNPSAWQNGTYQLPQPAVLTIPAAVTVTAGNSSMDWATIDFAGQICCYEGTSCNAHDTTKGHAYEFKRCISANSVTTSLGAACANSQLAKLALTAGGNVTASGTVTLRIDDGDSSKGTTKISTHIPVVKWNNP